MRRQHHAPPVARGQGDQIDLVLELRQRLGEQAHGQNLEGAEAELGAHDQRQRRPNPQHSFSSGV
jgi:hypothetical protein